MAYSYFAFSEGCECKLSSWKESKGCRSETGKEAKPIHSVLRNRWTSEAWTCWEPSAKMIRNVAQSCPPLSCYEAAVCRYQFLPSSSLRVDIFVSPLPHALSLHAVWAEHTPAAREVWEQTEQCWRKEASRGSRTPHKAAGDLWSGPKG